MKKITSEKEEPIKEIIEIDGEIEIYSEGDFIVIQSVNSRVLN